MNRDTDQVINDMLEFRKNPQLTRWQDELLRDAIVCIRTQQRDLRGAAFNLAKYEQEALAKFRQADKEADFGPQETREIVPSPPRKKGGRPKTAQSVQDTDKNPE